MSEDELITFSYEPHHTKEQVLDDLLELIYKNSVWTDDVV